jgi:ectoine hydroxylase-related dioxygenase (phytanoyl-CoA dioxygenase family)
MNKNFEYTVAKSFLSEETVSLLSSEFGRAFDVPEANKVYRGVVQFTAKQLENSEVLSPVSGQIISHFTDTLGASGIVLDKAWFVKSQSKDTDPNKLPYLPHFDKHRYLKAMIYLHDVVEDHGPIHFGRLLNPAEIDTRRRRLPANYKDLGLNTIKASEMISGMEPVLGKAGDVIFFDTNAAHRAGIVSEGFERNVIRFDFNVRGFNPQKSFIQRLFSVVSSRLR